MRALILAALDATILGQEDLTRMVLVACMARGHVLLDVRMRGSMRGSRRGEGQDRAGMALSTAKSARAIGDVTSSTTPARRQTDYGGGT